MLNINILCICSCKFDCFIRVYSLVSKFNMVTVLLEIYKVPHTVAQIS